jgi:hypothetical protein
MSDMSALRAQADFNAARAKAMFRELLALLTRRYNQLLAFDHVASKLRVGGPIYRGVQTVRLEQIVGSVNRYHDFDRAFLPTQTFTADRWQRVSRAWYDDISLPPILLYQVGDIYFVVDGHHRVSVAREQGQEFIDAEVRECQVKVPVTVDLQPEDLEVLGAKVEFLERSNLDRLRPGADVTATVLGGYDRMLEHIAVHRYFMGLDFKRDVSESEAVEHWYDSVYQPVVSVVGDSGVMKAFPKRTEADFYLWVMDHRHYLVSQGEADLVEPGRAAEEFVQHYLGGTMPPDVDGPQK